MSLFKIIMMLWLSGALAVQASESVILSSETGDTLMIHRLNNGELWGSFRITDQVVDSFADYELIVLQIDQNKPIKLDQEKRCGTPAGKTQKVAYTFEANVKQKQWQFSRVAVDNPDILKLTGWDKDTFQHMKADRRPEVVDFPIQGAIALTSLWQQFQQGNNISFRYTTSANESRQAQFELHTAIIELLAL